MRLFIGIDLPSDIKHDLFILSSLIQSKTQGRITSEPNFHLTLVFLGEQDELMKDKLIESLSKLNSKAFEFNLNDIGYFQKGERYIYYKGIKPSDNLKSLYQTVLKTIEPLNIDIHGVFSPHITLIRQGKSYPVSALNLPIKHSLIKVDEVTLFLSHQIGDELTYTPLYKVKLTKTNA